MVCIFIVYLKVWRALCNLIYHLFLSFMVLSIGKKPLYLKKVMNIQGLLLFLFGFVFRSTIPKNHDILSKITHCDRQDIAVLPMRQPMIDWTCQ